jgi:hypothetical protein
VHLATTHFDRPFLMEIEQWIQPFTIGLVTPAERSADLVGSGTLVQAGETRAILTAQHVVDALPSSGQLGLILSNAPGGPSIGVNTLSYIKV